MPTTYEELYAALVAIRDGDPDGNGETDDDTAGRLSAHERFSVGGYTIDCFVAGPLGISFGNAKDMWQVVDDKLVFVAEHPQL